MSTSKPTPSPPTPTITSKSSYDCDTLLEDIPKDEITSNDDPTTADASVADEFSLRTVPELEFPDPQATKDLEYPKGTFIFPDSFHSPPNFITSHRHAPDDCPRLGGYTVWFDLNHPFPTQHEFITAIRLAGSAGKGNISIPQNFRRGLSFGVQVYGRFYNVADVQAAANIRLAQIHSLMDRVFVRLCYPFADRDEY